MIYLLSSLSVSNHFSMRGAGGCKKKQYLNHKTKAAAVNHIALE
jgi:hypothetical protein